MLLTLSMSLDELEEGAVSYSWKFKNFFCLFVRNIKLNNSPENLSEEFILM